MTPGHETSPAEADRERELARAASAGDGQAFASLYETYEKRIYNFCLRLLGGTSDAEDATQEAFLKVFARLPDLDDSGFNFGAYLFTAARNSSYDMIDRHRRTEPVADLPDDGSGHLHRERADADIEPERAAMLSDQQAAVRAANERLPSRQREVLALREVEGMSYAEIASTMEMNSNSVAQLISRARTSLRSELHLGVASAVPPASSDCERAMPLLAKRQDAEITDPEDRVWLGTHLSGCSGCRLSSEEMAEAGISYRAWAPVAPALYLFRDTLARAAGSIGADWSAVERPAGEAAAEGSGPAAGPGPSRWRGRTFATVATTLVVGVGAGLFAARVADSTIDPTGFTRSSAVSSPVGGQAGAAGGGGQGGAGAVQQSGPATQPVEPAGDPPPESQPAQDPGPAPDGSSTPDRAPPATGQPGGDTPDDGGGGAPVTPPTPPTPGDPKQPGDTPATGPPMITNPKLPKLPVQPPVSLPGIPSIRG